MTMGPDGLVRDEAGRIIPIGRVATGNPQLQGEFRRKRLRALARMAQACRVDARRWATIAKVPFDRYDTEDPTSITALWDAIARNLPDEQVLPLYNLIGEAISGGVQTASDSILGDPFGVFVTGICRNPHDGKGDNWQTAVVKTGHRVDQPEAEKIIAYLKGQQNVNTCDVCGSTIDVWQCDVTRFETFKARPENRNPIMASPLRGV
jgi:hypothetical protein